MILICPYCSMTSANYDPETGKHAVVATTYQSGGENSCVVQCNWCGLSGPIKDSIPAAIEAWRSLARKEAA